MCLVSGDLWHHDDGHFPDKPQLSPRACLRAQNRKGEVKAESEEEKGNQEGPEKEKEEAHPFSFEDQGITGKRKARRKLIRGTDELK